MISRIFVAAHIEYIIFIGFKIKKKYNLVKPHWLCRLEDSGFNRFLKKICRVILIFDVPMV